MKWFIKVLRHYADFSGRAQRKEYWMFVLFNIIFWFAWTLLVQLLVMTVSNSKYNAIGLAYVAVLTYFAILLLPGMAVTVRRLHDVGKSGWMILVSLIPCIGGLWLFVLTVRNGQQGMNEYGPDPKTSPEIFTDKAKLRSVGIALIVGSLFGLLGILSDIIYNEDLFKYELLILNLKIYTVQAFLLLTVGIMLLTNQEREKTKPALAVLILYCCITCIHQFLSLPIEKDIIALLGGWKNYIDRLFYPIYILFFASFAAVLLFSPHKRSLIRTMAATLIVLAGISVLLYVRSSSNNSDLYGNPDNAWRLIYLLDIIQWSAFLLFAWTFFSKKEHSMIEVKEIDFITKLAE